MIVIKIESTQVNTKSGAKEGKAWTINFQQCAIAGFYVDGFPAKYPREMTIQLDEKNPVPYPVGDYVLSPESFYFGDFGRFTMGRMKLLPLSSFLQEVQQQVAPRKAA